MIDHLIQLHKDLGGLNSQVIHIAGTKGKGTTAHLLAKLLEWKGFKVGLFTSPIITSKTEKIQINGVCISEELLQEYIEDVYALDDSISEFEVLTLAGLKYFNDEACDYVVLEVGMGGEFDATNVILEKALTILTHLELEHTEFLGDSFEAIARTKLGICMPGIPLITPITQRKEALNVMKAMGLEVLYAPSEESGFHHPESVGMALLAYETLGFSRDADMTKRLASENIPGRMEIIHHGGHHFILDGAHTYDSIHYVMEHIQNYASKMNLDVNWGIHFLSDKNPELWKLFPMHNTAWLQLDDERAGTRPDALKELQMDEFLRVLSRQSQQVIAVLGSFRLVSQMKQKIVRE